MSQQNYAGMALKLELEKHPEVFTITDEAITAMEQRIANLRKAEEKAKPAEPVGAELRSLRKRLFDLEQNAKGLEIKVNNGAGSVQLLEERIAGALQQQKECERAGNVRGEFTYERQAKQLENELNDASNQLSRDQQYSQGAARELRAFHTEHGPRLKELTKAKPIATTPKD